MGHNLIRILERHPRIEINILIYNGNYQIMSLLNATIEMKKGGAFETRYQIESMPAWPYGSPGDSIRTTYILMDVLMAGVLVPCALMQLFNVFEIFGKVAPRHSPPSTQHQ